MIRVVIADDHPVVRTGLRQIVAVQPDMQVVGEAADGTGLWTALAGATVDVVLLDLAMPGAPFPGLLHDILARHAALRILVMSMHPEDQFAEPKVIRTPHGRKQFQIDRLRKFKHRHRAASERALDELGKVVESGGNVFAGLIQTVEQCSLGQITGRLFELVGRYRPSV